MSKRKVRVCFFAALCFLLSLPGFATVIRYGMQKDDFANFSNLSAEERTQVLKRHASDRTVLALQYVQLRPEDWQLIARMPNLEHLSARSTTIAPAQLEALGKCPKLQKLDLFNTSITDSGLCSIKPLRNITALRIDCESGLNSQHEYNLQAFPNLVSVDLMASPVGGIINLNCLLPIKHQLKDLRIECGTIENQAVLADLDHLTQLELWFPKFDDIGSKSLGQLQSLEQLILCDNRLTSMSYRCIAKLPNLKRLELHNNHVPGWAFRILAEMQCLETLLVGNGNYSDGDISVLSNLNKLKKLRFELGEPLDGSGFQGFQRSRALADLEFNGEKLNDYGLKSVAGIRSLHRLCIYPCKSQSSWANDLSKLTELETLAVGCPQKGADLWARAIGNMHNLTSAYFDNSDLNTEGVQLLLGDTKLKTLSLQNTAISDEAVWELVAMRNLKRLVLSGCNITDRALERIGALNKLEELELENTRITDAGLKYLKPLKQLRILALDYNDIDGSGLAVVHDLPALENLGLRSSHINDAELKNLAGSKLVSLDISNTEVTEHALPALKQLLRLKYLDFDGCGFNTAEEIPGKQTGRIIKLPSPLPANITAVDQQNKPEAKEELEKSLMALSAKLLMQPNSELLHAERATAYLKLGKYREALPDFEKAIDEFRHPKTYISSTLAPWWTSQLFNMFSERAFAYNALKDYELALKDATAAVRMNRLSVSARNSRAYAYLRTGQFTQALQDLNRALEINPNSAASLAYRSQVYERLGRTDLAKSDKEKAAKLGFKPEYPGEI